MMRVWSHRPRFSYLGLFIVSYVLGSGFAQSLAIVPGTGISIWPPSGLFIATLVLTPGPSWPWWVLGGCLAELFSNALWFDSPLRAAFLIYTGNALEAVVGAWLVNRFCGRPVRLETLREALAFIVAGAGIAPVISATIGSATLAWFGVQSQSFVAAWPLWWIGDATGVLIVAPLALVVLQNWRGKARFSAAQWVEACIVGLIFLGVAALSLSGYLPFAYIIMPPLLWVAVRFEFKGVAVTLTLLALITAVFTISGVSQFAGDPGSRRHKQVMLQLFLAISAFSALIVAAISRQHQLAVLTLHQGVDALRERERELSQLVNMVPSHVWRLTPDGEPTFFNKRMVEFIGLDVPEMDKPGMTRLAAMIEASIHPDDAAGFRDAIGRSLVTGEPFSMRYRLRRADGVYHWMSSQAEPMRDQDGRIVQWYGLCHDIDDEVYAQQALHDRERELRQLVDTLPVHIWSWTPAGKLAYVNKRSSEDLGLPGANFEDMTRVAQELIHPEDAPEVLRASANSLKTGNTFIKRYRRRWKDGSYRWIEARAQPLRDQDGTIVHWYQVSIDVDEEVRAQQALRDRERELQQLVDMVPVQIRRLTPEGKPTFFNKRLLDFFGLRDVSQLDKPGMTRLAAALQTLVHPEDAASLLQTVRHSLATGEPYFMKYRMRRADGEYRWVDGRGEAVRDQDGAILQWYAISIDIDDEMRAQEALRARERELRQLIDAVPALIWATTPDGTPSYVNKRFRDVTGATLEDITAPDGSPSLSVIHPDDRDVARQAVNHSFKTGVPYVQRYRQLRSGGNYRWTETRAEPLRDDNGAILQWYGVSVDIHDLVIAQEALQQSERQLEQMIDALPINILSFAPSGKITYTSKRYLENVGSPMAHIRDFDALARDLAHPEDFSSMHRRASDGFATGQPFVNRFRRRDKQGVYRWIEARAQPLRDANGAVVQWYIISIDLEDEMRAQQALRERERTLRQLVETLPAMLDCVGPNCEPIYRSQQLREFLGYELEELGGTEKSRLTGTLETSVHPDDLAGVKEKYAHSLVTGEPYARRHRLRRFDGEYRWVEMRAAPMRNAEGAIVQWNVICLDIDSEVRTQEQLRLAQESLARASQAASLAELSASIAHEVNQPLAAVVANSHACQRWLTAEPPNLERAQKTVERIIRDANAAADVVSRIRALFKQSVETRTNATLDSVIAEALELMAEEALRYRVRMDVDIESDLPLVALDRVQIQQVLINLIRNGMEAMDSTAGDRVLGIRVRRVEDAIQTEISDRGGGIEFPEKIFEPFFTTKRNGMGMGLAICRSIIESHDGRLWMEKNEPHGARFIFTLPVEAKAAA
ncbi:hypothetical protein ATN84_22750 [Paramesorhizobium deserti]|uniref:histidine kinase n=1 Tax=Paramesorhizobium deserti TaxID=1494590 RepID=A0A135HNC3_9HYPH|nr:PAS domain-containing protein [Paramesorhizobium deserti]KXF74717.1 hypothetical protein ATN84_22750 [Paramesorhizobium deserti]